MASQVFASWNGEEVFEVDQQAHVAIERRRTVELNEHVDAAVRARFVPGNGPEERQRSHRIAARHFLPMGRQTGDYVTAPHDRRRYTAAVTLGVRRPAQG